MAIELTRLGASVVIKIRKGCPSSVRSVILSAAEYQELKAKIEQFENKGGLSK